MNKRKFNDGGIFREGMEVPQDIDGASAAPMKRPMPMKKPMPKKPMMPVPAKKPMPAPGYKSGGSVGSASKRADGVATKGKTKGTQIKMAGGGKC
jgi:hypothetical protein